MSILPKEKSKVNRNFKDQRFGMIGISGIGKSEFWTHEEKAFFIDCEGGLKAYEIFQSPARSFGDLRDIYIELRKLHIAGNFPYSLIVLDTIDRIVDFAEEEVIEIAKGYYKSIANQIHTIGDVPNGGGWSKTRETVMGFLNNLYEFPCAIAYIGHINIKKIDEGTRKYDKSTITLWASMGKDVLAWGDHTMHVEAQRVGEKLQRTVFTLPTQSREAKSRGGMIPNGVRWSEDSAENYREFRKLFV